MIKFLKALAVVAAVLAVAPAQAAEIEKNIMTGGPKGTYIKIGRDIAAIGKECARRSMCGKRWLAREFHRRSHPQEHQFGIVQSDVLEYSRPSRPMTPRSSRPSRREDHVPAHTTRKSTFWRGPTSSRSPISAARRSLWARRTAEPISHRR